MWGREKEIVRKIEKKREWKRLRKRKWQMRESSKKKEKCKKKKDRMLLTQLYVATTIFFVIQNGSNRSFSLVIMCQITMPPIRSVASQQRFSTGNMLNKKMLIAEKVFFPIRYLIHLNQGNQRTIVKTRQNVRQKKKPKERERHKRNEIYIKFI